MVTFGSFIKALREKEGWPQRKLAHELDIDVSVLSKIENEDRYPKKRIADMIRIISRLFNVPTERLKQIYLSDEIALLLVDEPDFKEILKESEGKVGRIRINKQIR